MASILYFLFAWIWIMSSLLSFGYTLQHFQKEYPVVSEKILKINFHFAVFMGILGVVGLITVACCHGYKHGLYPLNISNLRLLLKS